MSSQASILGHRHVTSCQTLPYINAMGVQIGKVRWRNDDKYSNFINFETKND